MEFLVLLLLLLLATRLAGEVCRRAGQAPLIGEVITGVLLGPAVLASSAVVWRLSVPPAEAPAVLERLRPERYLLDWGGGLIFAAYSSVDAAHVRGALTSGHATLLKAPATDRAARPA